MGNPLVSVVLCSYNGAAHIAQQIDSILEQNWKPLELIISDDNSTDGTKQVLSRYEHHPGVQVFYQPVNTGLARNFAFAAKQARGEMIAFADQDDIWLSGKIEALVDSRGNYPLVYSDSLLVDEYGNSLHKRLSDLRKMYTGEDSRGYILYSCVWGHGMLVTRALLERSYPMPPGIHHDIWLAFMAFLNGGIKYHDQVLTHYRQHGRSSSITLPQPQGSRDQKQRYNDYAKKLEWIRLMQQNERPVYQPFYKKLLKLYSKKRDGKYVFPLLNFMLKNRKSIFMFSKKGFLSQLVEILKQARGIDAKF